MIRFLCEPKWKVCESLKKPYEKKALMNNMDVGEEVENGTVWFSHKWPTTHPHHGLFPHHDLRTTRTAISIDWVLSTCSPFLFLSVTTSWCCVFASHSHLLTSSHFLVYIVSTTVVSKSLCFLKILNYPQW